MNIAVIDDSRAMLVVIKTMLAELGFNNVSTSTSATKALKIISKEPSRYDVVLTDLNMPEMDGMELIRQLGEISYKGGVIIVSGMDARVVDLANDIAKQHQVCLLGSLNKPVDPEDLHHILMKMDHINERKFTNYHSMDRLELMRAISERRVVPHYQPKLDTITKTVTSVEVLARISQIDTHKPIMPGSFIPTAEKHGLIDMMTMQLIEATAEEYCDLQKVFGSDIKLSINLSPLQLDDLECPNKLGFILDTHQVPVDKVILEITEEYALKSAAQLETLNRLRMRGYGISMDDFGTGYTSLQQLRNLPFSEVKIDRSLISNIHRDNFSQVVVKSVADITEQIGISLVAEGIEYDDELVYLSDNHPGVILQGYYICKPAPVHSLKFWYKSWQAEYDLESATAS